MTKTVAPGIQKLGEQHYRVWWTEDGTGQRRSRVIHDSLEQAKKLRASMIDAQTRGEYVTPRMLTVATYLTAWLDGRELRRDAAQSTHERYRSLLLGSLSGRLGAVPLQQLAGEQITAYYKWCLSHEITNRGTLVNAETVYKRHKVLKQALADAVRERLIVKNPAIDAKAPKQQHHEALTFTREDTQVLLGALHGDLIELPARIALVTGLRLGEVLGLTWRALELPAHGAGKLTVSAIVSETAGKVTLEKQRAKTRSSLRTITIDAELMEVLRAHRKAQAEQRLAMGPAWKRNDLVICTYEGGVRRPSRLSYDFTAVARMLEEDGALSTTGATFHTLRHTNATLLLQAGVPVRVVSQRLGHKRVEITLGIYAHALPGQDEDAAEVAAGLFSGYSEPTMHISCTSEGIEKAAEAAL